MAWGGTGAFLIHRLPKMWGAGTICWEQEAVKFIDILQQEEKCLLRSHKPVISCQLGYWRQVRGDPLVCRRPCCPPEIPCLPTAESYAWSMLLSGVLHFLTDVRKQALLWHKLILLTPYDTQHSGFIIKDSHTIHFTIQW